MTSNVKFSESGFRLESGTKLVRALHSLFFVIPACLYFVTACRTPGWADATLVVSYVTRLGLSSWVNSHNLFNLLGYLWLKLFPAQNIHFYLVLLCGVLGALAVYFIFRTVLELTSDVISAGIAALVLMVSHSLWWHSTMVEVYTLSSAILAIMLFFIVRYERTANPINLYLAALFFGLGCCNHLQMGLFAFAFLILVVYKILRPQPHTRTGGQLAIAVLCFLVGVSLYLVLFIRDVREDMIIQGLDFRQALRNTYSGATGGKFKQLMFTRDMTAPLKRFWRFSFFFWLIYNFPSPALAMGFYGFLVFWKKRAFRLSFFFFVAAILAQALWSANYFVWDMYAFTQLVFVLFSIPIGLAAERLLRSAKALRTIFLVLLIPMLAAPGFIYGRMHTWYKNVKSFNHYFNSYPQISWTAHTWDPIEYVVNTNKRKYDKVERYANALFAVLPRGAHLLNSDSRSDYPLRFYYRNLYNVRKDIIHESLFSPFLTDEEGKWVAARLKRALNREEPVYSSSILYPEKVVLDQLFLLNDPSRTLESLRSMSETEYVRSFPGVNLEKIVLVEEDQLWIYRLSRKKP